MTTLQEKMNEGIQEIQFKLSRAKMETNYNKKVRLLKEIAESADNYSDYWEERLANLID